MRTWQANKIDKNGTMVLDRFSGAGYPKHKWKLIRPLQQDGLVEIPTPLGRSIFVDGNLNVYTSILRFYRNKPLKWAVRRDGTVWVCVSFRAKDKVYNFGLTLLRLSRYLFGDKYGFTCDAFNFSVHKSCYSSGEQNSALISPKLGVLSNSVRYKMKPINNKFTNN